MRGVFVTGTDTNVGKTIVSAALVIALRRHQDVKYWKPIQTGIENDDDTKTVDCLADCDRREVWTNGYRFEPPVSPHLAASLSSTRIELHKTMRFIDRVRNNDFWIVEGAGGVLVPLNDQDTMCDLMIRLGLPVIVVARPGLGTINHTLLTIEALSRRYINIAGVVFNGGENVENEAAVERFGKVRVIARIPRFAEPIVDHLPLWAERNSDLFNRIGKA